MNKKNCDNVHKDVLNLINLLTLINIHFFSIRIEAKLSDLQINIILSRVVVLHNYVLCGIVFLDRFPSLYSIDKYFIIT